ncbi:MAG: serine/threonine-protein kinase [Polyangiales bacterium]
MRPGETIAERFLIEREVASGGMGTVLRAVDRLSGEPVALKVMKKSNAATVERFVREAALLAELRHPSIVRHVAHGTTSAGEPWLAMEWLEGCDLDQRLSHGAVLSLEDALTVTRKIAEALQVLHARGLVHRDVKPSNVFLSGGEIARVKLLDFGTARGIRDVQGLTVSGAILGTPFYMAPEQARGSRDLDARVDVFALGTVLFQCLAGHPPFRSADVLALLAKIVLEAPPRLAEVAEGIPSEVDALVHAMLAKNRADRPRDGADVVERVTALSALGLEGTRSSRKSALGSDERRVLCVVLTGRPDAFAATVAHDRIESDPLAPIRVANELHGGQLERLADGSLLSVIAGSPSGASGVTDLAARAGRIALAIQRAFPGAAVSIATGRGELSARVPIGEALERASSSLPHAACVVRIDEGTAGLLDARFEIAGDEHGLVLRRERETPEATRKLLGKPTPFVGRERELSVLEGIFRQSVEEPMAQVALVTAEAGAGKSRLRHELVARMEKSERAPSVLFARGDSLRAGSPFGLVSQAIRRTAGVLDGEPIDVGRKKLRARISRNVSGESLDRIVAFVGELANVEFPDDAHEALRAARRDPLRMGDSMRAAFVDWLREECAQSPVLLVLDDLHWGDLPSIRFVDHALRTLHDAPLTALAIARPEVHQAFPGLFKERGLQEIRLGAVPRKASERLVREVLGDRANDETTAWILDRAQGNAFALEELIRAVASGNPGALPDTVLGMLEARLDALGSEAKRALRAASVFGETFWRGGVMALLGDDASGIDDCLSDLVAHEVIERRGTARIPSEGEYVFRHALVRDAAYAMLTSRDRTLGHRLAGDWLEKIGEHDAIALAEHFARGDEPSRSVEWFRRAAEQALEGDDLVAAIERADRGIASGAEGETLGALHLVRANALGWLGRNEEALDRAQEALVLLASGSAPFFRAAGEAMAACGRLGRVPSLIEVARKAQGIDAVEGALEAQLVALCRAMVPLTNCGALADAKATMERVHALSPSLSAIEPSTAAQVLEARAIVAGHEGDMWSMAAGFEKALVDYTRSGSQRDVALCLASLGWALVELGQLDSAEAALERSIALSERLGARGSRNWASFTQAEILGYRGDVERACSAMREVAETFRAQKNARQEGWSRIHLSLLLSARGEFATAEREASAAHDVLLATRPLLSLALAAQARALIGLGRVAEALDLARQAHEWPAHYDFLFTGDATLRLVLAEALDASGDREAARAAILAARDVVLHQASRATSPEASAQYLALPDRARTLALADAWS